MKYYQSQQYYKLPISSPNDMFLLVKDALNKFSEYILLIIKEIIINNRNEKRIGLH